MTAQRFDKIDELATDLSDLKLTVEELQDELPADADRLSSESRERVGTGE